MTASRRLAPFGNCFLIAVYGSKKGICRRVRHALPSVRTRPAAWAVGLERGASDLARRSELNDWLAHKVRPMFTQRILPVTEDVMLKWRLMVDEGRKSGHTFSQPDLIIAATAQQDGLIVVSRDPSEFLKARVPVFSPWTDSLPVLERRAGEKKDGNH